MASVINVVDGICLACPTLIYVGNQSTINRAKFLVGHGRIKL